MSKETTVQAVTTDAARWRQAKEIFLDALEIAETDRDKFLAERCGTDSALKREVELLIEAHFESESFIENPAFKISSVFENSNRNQQERIFGNYRIIREIGVGGMGAVYLAERADGEFSRQVAVKIVRQNFADKELISRFKRERQILASLDHPFIAKLLDGGVSGDGTPFLAMEYVDGEPLTAFAAAHNLSVEDRLRLFIKICSAVADAHRNLVVHRDLKPSNIFVTQDGTPKLLDFGLAKLIDESLNANDAQTLTAFRAMTPAYASPEQLRGESITTSSDIYSLGVVLYELLTGNRPFHFKNKNLNEMIDVVCKDEPLRPSEAVTLRTLSRETGRAEDNEKRRKADRETHRQVETITGEGESSTSTLSPPPIPLLPFSSSRLKGDLDNIVLTAMMKEPARRYPTVEKFTEDIERHLAGLPIRARPNTLSYRAGKFIRRNFWGAAAGLLILLTLIGGIAATLWQAHQANQQRARAENHFNDVRRLANSVLFEINPKIENLSGATEAREIIVKRALEYLDALASEAGNDADLQRELAAAYEKVGDVQGNPGQPNLGDMKGALISYQKAQTLRQNLVEANSLKSDLNDDLATNYEKTGYLLWWSDDTAGAVDLFEKALVIRRKLLQDNPESVAYRTGLASLLMTYGDVPAWDKDTANALEKFDEAMAILKKLIAENPNDTQLQLFLGRCYFRTGNAENFAGDYENALKNLVQSETIFQNLVAKDPNDYYFRRGLWQTKFRQCESYLFKPDKVKAVETCPQLIDLANNLVVKDSKDKLIKHDLASSYYYTGEAFAAFKEYEKAILNYQKASEITSEMTAQFPDNTEYQRSLATYDIGTSESQLKIKQIPQALENAQKAEAILERIMNEDTENKMPQLDLATVYNQYGDIYVETKDKPKAREWFNKTLVLLRELEAQNSLTTDEKRMFPEIEGKLKKLE